MRSSFFCQFIALFLYSLFAKKVYKFLLFFFNNRAGTQEVSVECWFLYLLKHILNSQQHYTCWRAGRPWNNYEMRSYLQLSEEVAEAWRRNLLYSKSLLIDIQWPRNLAWKLNRIIVRPINHNSITLAKKPNKEQKSPHFNAARTRNYPA